MSQSPAPTEDGFKLGAEPKKVGLLLLFLAIAAFLWWRNSSDSPSSPSPSTATPPPASAKLNAASRGQLPVGATARGSAPARPSRRQNSQSQKNVFEVRYIDPSRGDVDPTLRLDLLDRLKNVKLGAPGRSLFESGPIQVAVNTPKVIIPVRGKPGQPQPNSDPAQPVAPPPPPPIPLKFYGFIRSANKRDVRRGFFMDGDVILVATEGETLKQRYKVIRFQDTVATVEDTQNKNQQDLNLVPEAKGEN